MSKTLLSGSKFNSNHQTYLPGATRLLLALKAEPLVKKVFLGEVARTRSGKESAKIAPVNAGVFQITYRSVSAVQKFRIVCPDQQVLIKLLRSHQLMK